MISVPSDTASQSTGARNTLVLVVYTAAIFTSALLLFSVQPLFTKMVLPRLGGSPAVWSVAMVFFQSLLLGGYAYAHYLMTLKSRTAPVVIHLVLLAVALLTLPLSIATGITGIFSIWYRPAKPARSGGCSPGGTRVPSGKIRIDRPSASSVCASRTMRLSAPADASRSTTMTP